MKRFVFQGAVFVTALALAVTMVPAALAQSLETEEELTEEVVAEEEPVEEPVVVTVLSDFRMGSALAIQNGKMGLLRWDGVFLLEPEYDELTEVGYGVYLGRKGALWELLSISAVETFEGTTHALYSDQVSVTVYEDAALPQIVLRDQEGTVTRILVNALPQLLESRRVPGWQFPLTARRAAFEDVAGDQWYAHWINLAYSVGMMEGIGEGKFEPLRNLTVAETIRLAACLESRALQDDFHLQELTGPRWYSSSVAYCEASGVISSGEYSEEDLNRPITRAEMADILFATTPVRGMKEINRWDQVEALVPDVEKDDFAADAIYGLYAKGILNGTDNIHSFHGDEVLSRAEAAAIIARIARPEQRISLWLEA